MQSQKNVSLKSKKENLIKERNAIAKEEELAKAIEKIEK